MIVLGFISALIAAALCLKAKSQNHATLHIVGKRELALLAPTAILVAVFSLTLLARKLDLFSLGSCGSSNPGACFGILLTTGTILVPICYLTLPAALTLIGFNLFHRKRDRKNSTVDKI